MEIAIISGKGGTGKSILSAALATVSEEVVLADCDVDAANQWLIFHPVHEEEEPFTGSQKAVIDSSLCTNCGVCVSCCRFNAIQARDQEVVISETFCDGCLLCVRLCPQQAIRVVKNEKSRLYSGRFRHGRMVYGRLAPGEENSGKLVNLVRAKAREQAKQHELKTIIIDGPPGIGCPVISAITGVEQLVIVTEPSLSAIHDMQRAMEMSEKFNLKRHVVINKYDLDEEMIGEIEKICSGRGIGVIGKIPFDSAVITAMTNRKSIIEWAPGSDASKAIRGIHQKITQRNE
jgi:MinD superfamily P-loop ATPase